MSMMAAASNSTGAEAAELRPINYHEIKGWSADAHGDALSTFRRGCAAILRRSHGSAKQAMHEVCRAASELAHDVDDATARVFFETSFQPHLVLSHGQDKGLFTGYFEPVINAARDRSPAFPVPVLGLPANLVAVNQIGRPAGLPADLTHVLRTDGGYIAAPTRGEINSGALAGKAPVIAWLADPIDAFFLHVQGSGRLVYADGTGERIAYAGKNGHPYTSIGKVLVERGAMNREQVTMASLRAWLAVAPGRGAALMNENRSYVFFRRLANHDPALGPLGQLEVALTPGRSLAVDLAHYSSNQPIWLDTTLPGAPSGPGGRFQRLMIAQDTGSAIRGPIRGDIFFGSGAAAGEIAGSMKAEGAMIVLTPLCREC